MAISLKLSVNGAPVTVSVEPNTLLVHCCESNFA